MLIQLIQEQRGLLEPVKPLEKYILIINDAVQKMIIQQTVTIIQQRRPVKGVSYMSFSSH